MNFPFTLLDNRDFDAAGFGTNAVDYLIQVPHYPEFNSKVELVEHTQAAGGEIATTMAGLQRLGLSTAYAGRFGSDAAGEIGLRSLIDEGVNIEYVETIEGARTQVAYIVIDIRNGERTVIWQRDSRLGYAENEAPIDIVSRCRVLHMTPHDTAACTRLARTAKERGVIVSIDADNLFEGLDELLPLVDICMMSADFPQKLVGLTEPRAALKVVTEKYGCAVTGLTLGDGGSISYCGGQFIETPGFTVPGDCVDTTGAGDAYRTGFLFGLLTGEPVEESARIANAVAALKCRGLGARTTLPTQQELKTLLKKYRLF